MHTQLLHMSEALGKCSLQRVGGVAKTAAEFNTLSTQLPGKLPLPGRVKYPRPGLTTDATQLGASGVAFHKSVQLTLNKIAKMAPSGKPRNAIAGDLFFAVDVVTIQAGKPNYLAFFHIADAIDRHGRNREDQLFHE